MLGNVSARVKVLATVFLIALAFGIGMASTAEAESGLPLILGRINVADVVTTLTRQGSGPALSLVTKDGPPLKVNSDEKVKNLNADTVDGLSAEELRGQRGPRGERGAQGETGPRGEIGPQGEQGLEGEQGAQGEKGEQGSQGELGSQGERGPQGEKGAQGERGVQGLTGPRGPSNAYVDGPNNATISYGDYPMASLSLQPGHYVATVSSTFTNMANTRAEVVCRVVPGLSNANPVPYTLTLRTADKDSI